MAEEAMVPAAAEVAALRLAAEVAEAEGEEATLRPPSEEETNKILGSKVGVTSLLPIASGAGEATWEVRRRPRPRPRRALLVAGVKNVLCYEV